MYTYCATVILFRSLAKTNKAKVTQAGKEKEEEEMKEKRRKH